MATATAPAAAEPSGATGRLRGFWARIAPAPATERLWPFSLAAALVLVPLLWLLLGLVLWGASALTGWPAAGTSSGIVYLVAIIGLTPVWLLLVDSLARRGAVITTKFVALDFSKGETTTTAAPLQLNVPGLEGAPINSSSVKQIHEVLSKATTTRVLHIDLGAGDEWWVTRLFALVAGAVDAGSPETIVFIGRQAESGRSQDGAFLGWIDTREAFRVLLVTHPELKSIRDRCRAISRLVEEATASSPPAPIGPPIPVPTGVPADIWTTATEYIQNIDFQQLGSDTKVRILLEQLGRYEAQVTPEKVERVTRGTLAAFDEALYTEAIDITWPVEQKIDALLRARGRYVAETTDGAFSRLLACSVVQSDVLRQLALPSPQSS